MKKMYNQPATEVVNLKTARLMDGLTVSLGGNPPDEGSAHAPKKGDRIPY